LVYEQGLRLDKWLWFARLMPSRSAAQALCESKRLRMDGRVIEKASTLVRPGAVLSFARAERLMAVRVEALVERRGAYVQARLLYTDLNPLAPPPPCAEGRDTHEALTYAPAHG